MHILVTRPEPDGEALASRLTAERHRVTLEPLLRIELDPGKIDLDGVQATIATSRNGLRALAAASVFPEARRLPLLAVGPATAALAGHLGFEQIIRGQGSARHLGDLILATIDPKRGALLHLAGDTLAFDLAAALAPWSFTVRVAIVYRSIAATAFTPGTVEAIAAGRVDAVISMSPRASKVYVRLVERAGLAAAARPLVYFCLSDAVARPFEALGAPRIEVAQKPNSEDMLRLVNRIAKRPA